MAPRRKHRSRERERGFVLVGVIMFVLALTILGLSLYGLSGIEVDFIQDSLDREQAFYDASGGLERAKWILAQQGTLQSVKNGIPDGNGVVYARAWYPDHVNKDSAGTIDWSSSDKIAIRVKAVRGTRQGRTGTASSMVECTYTPDEIRNLYQNLINSSGVMIVKPVLIPLLKGRVWQNNPDTSWTNVVPPPSRTPPVVVGGVPVPDVAGFVARFPTAAGYRAPYTQITQNRGQYDLSTNGFNPIPGVEMFRGTDQIMAPPVDQFDQRYGIYNHSTTMIQVANGVSIWMIDAGVRFGGAVEVRGPGNSVLVLVVHHGVDQLPSGNPPAAPIGVWLDATWTLSLSPNVSVIVVTDGTVSFSTTGSADATLLPWLSVFASDVYINVPTLSALFLYNSGTLPVRVSNLIDNGLLPNVAPGQNRRLDRVAGTWSLVTKSDPDN
jgi:hypothetical protein